MDKGKSAGVESYSAIALGPMVFSRWPFPGSHPHVEDHVLVVRGPYRIVRHPVYTGYLALLHGSGLASLNVCLLVLGPVSLLGILIQASSEDQLLGARFGREYECYAGRVGRLVPRFGNRVAEPSAVPGLGGIRGSGRKRSSNERFRVPFGEDSKEQVCSTGACNVEKTGLAGL